MKEKHPQKLNYNIFPGKVITALFSFIGSAITIMMAIILLNKFYAIITILCLSIIILVVLIFRVFFRLKKVLNSYNTLVERISKENDNHHTLTELLKQKNNEIDSLSASNTVLKAQLQLLYFMFLQEEKPDPIIIEQALEIDRKDGTQ